MRLAAATQSAIPQPRHLEAEHAQPRAVVGHAEVPAMSGHHRAQVLALLFDGSVHAPSEFDLDRLEFGSQAFGTRQPQNHEELGDVRIEYPVHPPHAHTHRYGVQRIVRAAPRPEAAAEPDEVLFKDGVEHLDRGALDELVLPRGHAQRPFAAVGLLDVHPPHRLGPVTPSGQPSRMCTHDSRPP